METEEEEKSEDVHISIPPMYLSDTLDGVTWNGKKEDKRKFPEAFTEVLRTCNITGRSKLIIKERFLNLYRHYRKKYKYTSIFHNTSKIIISVGSIIIPALLTLDSEISERSHSSQIIYYTTFSISIIVTITNALSEIMQFNKKYYTYATIKENLKTEGWLFASLAGKYKNYTDHSECWRKFVNKIEKLNIYAINSNLILSTQRTTEEGVNPNLAWNHLGFEGSTNNSITDTHNEEEIIFTQR